MKKYIVLLAGRINSGKDFASDILVNNHGWVKLPFAENLKSLTSKKFNISLEDLNTQHGKKKMYDNIRTYRDLLIETAHFYKTNNKNIFVDDVISLIKSHDNNIVISDFRYPYEYSQIFKELSNEYIIKSGLIVRDSATILEIESETSLKDFKFDFVLYNTGSREDLNKELLYHIKNDKPSTEPK